MNEQLFEVKKEHIKLLRRMYIGYNDDCEFGAPEVDPKRPYGNSDVYQDMLEIIGLKEIKNGIYEFELGKKKWLLKGDDIYNIELDNEDELCKQLLELHKSMDKVIQILMINLGIEPGIYEEEGFGNGWRIKNEYKNTNA